MGAFVENHFLRCDWPRDDGRFQIGCVIWTVMHRCSSLMLVSIQTDAIRTEVGPRMVALLSAADFFFFFRLKCLKDKKEASGIFLF